MLIHEVVLKNIRSYEDATVDFSEGVTLLAGDIGAGKSTILLAVEFALFGIRRGDLAGDGLLRHGAKDGSVTLRFSCGKEYTVRRDLKRSSNGVRQDGGYLVTEGVKEELSANELKARVLSILGYPEQLLTKSKGFVFRYTVYTPQEEMKRIVLEPPQERLDTLRSVFGMDVYKAVAQNAQLVLRAVREKRRYLEGQVEDLSDLEEQRDSLAERLVEAAASEERAAKERGSAEERLSESKKKGERLEAAYQKEQERKQRLARIEERLRQAQQQRESLLTEQESLQKASEEEEPAVEDPSAKLDALREKREKARTVLERATARSEEIARRRKELADDASKIDALTVCPVCRQSVGPEHKEHIASERKRAMGTLAAEDGPLREKIQKARDILDRIQAQEKLLREREVAYREHAAHLARMEAEKKRLNDISELLEKNATAISVAREELAAVQRSDFDDDAYTAHKELLEALRDKAQEAAVAAARAAAEHEALMREKESLAGRIADRKKQKASLSAIRTEEKWLSDAFSPVAERIERAVLGSIHAEFGRRFTEWCAALLEDDALFGTLGEDFSPLVSQDGYDADILHLSGGERTAVALAYRLALNTVVNGFVQGIRTTDLLILDEPTDGFSTEQLDRVRDVLRELSNRQVIIVSHEQKMEAFVDRVLRIEKHAGVSVVS